MSDLNIFFDFMNNDIKNTEMIILNENYNLIELQKNLSKKLENCYIYNNFCNVDYNNVIFNTYKNKIFGINKISDYTYYIWKIAI
jgi:hypothetical protein